MPFLEPKTNWQGGNIPTSNDLNRIEENTLFLKENTVNLFNVTNADCYMLTEEGDYKGSFAYNAPVSDAPQGYLSVRNIKVAGNLFAVNQIYTVTGLPSIRQSMFYRTGYTNTQTGVVTWNPWFPISSTISNTSSAVFWNNGSSGPSTELLFRHTISSDSNYDFMDISGNMPYLSTTNFNNGIYIYIRDAAFIKYQGVAFTGSGVINNKLCSVSGTIPNGSIPVSTYISVKNYDGSVPTATTNGIFSFKASGLKYNK